MGEVYFLDKTKADKLSATGFKYIVRNIGGKKVFVFIQTSELMKELNSKFEDGSYVISKIVKF